jgi:hypothetical protein
MATLHAYARTACAWADGGFHRAAEDHASVAAALLRAAEGEPGVLVDLVDRLAASPGALDHLLRALKTAATYQSQLVRPLATVWPPIMELVLTQPTADLADRARRERTRLVVEVLPGPVLSMADTDPDRTLRQAAGCWLGLDPLIDLIDAWTFSAAGFEFATESLVGLLRTQPVQQQLDPGLRWVRQIAVQADGTVSSLAGLLPNWLRELRPALTLPTRFHYLAIVDALALSRHPDAAALQQLDE